MGAIAALIVALFPQWPRSGDPSLNCPEAHRGGGTSSAVALPAVSDLLSSRSFSIDRELLEPAESHSNLEARLGDRLG